MTTLPLYSWPFCYSISIYNCACCLTKVLLLYNSIINLFSLLSQVTLLYNILSSRYTVESVVNIWLLTNQPDVLCSTGLLYNCVTCLPRSNNRSAFCILKRLSILQLSHLLTKIYPQFTHLFHILPCHYTTYSLINYI